MPDWEIIIPDIPLIQAVLWVVGIGLLLGIIYKLWPFVRNAVAIVDALVTLPETGAAVTALTTKVTALTTTVRGMNTQIEGIHHETHKNDGSSIKDAVGRVEKGVAGLYRELGAVKEDVGVVKDEIVRLHDADEAIRGELDEATSGSSGSTRRALRAARERERRTITAGDIPPRPSTE